MLLFGGVILWIGDIMGLAPFLSDSDNFKHLVSCFTVCFLFLCFVVVIGWLGWLRFGGVI